MACESVPHHENGVEDDKIENEADNTRSEIDLEEQRINEEEIRKSHELEEQELILTKKIKDLESTDIEEDIESDDVVTFDPTSMHRDYTEYLKTIPWSDQIDEMEKLARMLSIGSSDVNPYVAATVEQFEELVKRYPGRAQELRMKLASRSERKDSEEKNLARRQKADEKRQQLLTEKAAKMRELVQKVEEVKAQQFQLAQERKYRLYLKLKKAEENRQLHLSVIRRKAHDEEEKLKEIAFINELEAQNRRHESLALRQEQEERLQTLIEERQRKVGEKAAKEAAVEERRRVLEAERQEKLEKMQEKRRKKEEIIGRKQREKENERLEIAREKAREREERLQARQAAQIATAEELQKKIQQKQESSARRHEESIELKRQKALERGSLRTIISDEESYQSSTKHGIQDDYRTKGDSKIQKQEGEKSEKLKAYRKRAKKIRMRISAKGKEFMERTHQQYIEQCSSIPETSKPLEGLSKLVTKDLRLWDNEDMASFDQYSTDIINLMKDKVEQEGFQNNGGYLCLSQLYLYFDDILKEKSTHTFNRIFMKVNNIYKGSCFKNIGNVKFVFQSGCIFSLCDSLRYRMNALLERRRGFHCDTVLATLTEMLNEIELTPETKEQNFRSALNDFMSYVVCSGLIGRLVDFIRFVTESEDTKLDYLIAPTIEFFSALTKLPARSVEYIDTLESSDLMGVLSLLYCSLQEASPKSILPTFTTHTMKFLLTVARSDIKLFQGILGAEGMYLQLRHIASYLLTFCAQDVEHMNLLHLVIEIIGFFSVHNKHNQMLLQSGQMPTVLQQLVCLPFKYFCEKQLSNILFPTLIACCHDNPTNKALLENELNYTLLDKFLHTEEAHSIKLIKTFLDWKE